MDCNFDFNVVGSVIVIFLFVILGSLVQDIVVVIWIIFDINSNFLIDYMVVYIVLDMFNGVVEFGLLVYCYQKLFVYMFMMVIDCVFYEIFFLSEVKFENVIVVNLMSDQLMVFFGEVVNGLLEVVFNSGSVVKIVEIFGKIVQVVVVDLQQGFYFVCIYVNGKMVIVKVIK